MITSTAESSSLPTKPLSVPSAKADVRVPHAFGGESVDRAGDPWSKARDVALIPDP